MPGKRIIFDDEMWTAIQELIRDRATDLQQLSDEAFADILKKYGRAVDLREALAASASRPTDKVSEPPRETGRKRK